MQSPDAKPAQAHCGAVVDYNSTMICQPRIVALLLIGFLMLHGACTRPGAAAGGAEPAKPSGRILLARGDALYIANADGSGERKLVDGVAAELPAEWSPDGMEILFFKRGAKSADVWVIPADGAGEARNLTHVEAGTCRSPAWSDDSTRIAFMRDNPAGLYTMNRDGSNPRKLTHDGQREQRPSWSADGKFIVYGELVFIDESAADKFRMELLLARADGSGVSKIPTGEGPTDMAEFAPAGMKVAYRGQRRGNDEICAVDLGEGAAGVKGAGALGAGATGAGANSATEINLTKSKEDERDPRWSPDGNRLAFWRRAGAEEELWTMKGDGSDAKKATSVKAAAHPGAAEWSPDGKFLAYGSDDGVWIVAVAGDDAPRSLAKGGGAVRWRK